MLVRIGDKCSGDLTYRLHARRYRDGMTLTEALKENMGEPVGITYEQKRKRAEKKSQRSHRKLS